MNFNKSQLVLRKGVDFYKSMNFTKFVNKRVLDCSLLV